jgi:hypothetical protein
MTSNQFPELAARITAARATLGDYQATLAAAPLAKPPGREWMLRLARTLEDVLDASETVLAKVEAGQVEGGWFLRGGRA